MSFQVECPICAKTSKHVETSYLCPCGRTSWMDGKGWFLSWEFIKNLKDQMWNDAKDLHMNLNGFLDNAIKEEMKVAVLTLDKSTVKLYCPNDKCKVEGFITRTKAQAEKNVHTCDICNSVLTW